MSEAVVHCRVWRQMNDLTTEKEKSGGRKRASDRIHPSTDMKSRPRRRWKQAAIDAGHRLVYCRCLRASTRSPAGPPAKTVAQRAPYCRKYYRVIRVQLVGRILCFFGAIPLCFLQRMFPSHSVGPDPTSSNIPGKYVREV